MNTTNENLTSTIVINSSINNESEKLIKKNTKSKCGQYFTKDKILHIIKMMWPIILLLIGQVVQGASLPFWISSFTLNIGGPYFIISWASFLFSTFFGILFIIMKCATHAKTVSFKKYWKSYLIQGAVNALNGIFIVYSSPITRTPPVLFCVVTNLGIFFGIGLTRLLVKEKKHVNYCNIFPIAGMICISISAILILVAKIVTDLAHQTFSALSIMWICFALLGCFFGACYNILQERYLKTSNVELTGKYEQLINYFSILFWTSLVQLIVMIICWWVDILPIIGYSKYDTFLNHVGDAFKCFFGGSGYKNPMFGILFSFGYILTYIAVAVINKDSGNFAIYIQAAQTPIVSFIFMITGLGTESTPVWSVIPAVFTVTTGIILWKTWENKKSNSNLVKTESEKVIV